MNSNDLSVEDLLEMFDFTGEDKGPRKGITFWVTEDEHAAYLKIQADSKRKFGKSVERFLKRVIKAKADKAA